MRQLGLCCGLLVTVMTRFCFCEARDDTLTNRTRKTSFSLSACRASSIVTVQLKKRSYCEKKTTAKPTTKLTKIVGGCHCVHLEKIAQNLCRDFVWSLAKLLEFCSAWAWCVSQSPAHTRRSVANVEDKLLFKLRCD